MEQVEYGGVGIVSGTISALAGVAFLVAAFLWAPVACGTSAAGLEVQLVGLAILFFGLAVGLYTLYIPGMLVLMAAGGTVLAYGLILASMLGCF
ncbi:MAG TPA: hypothetical protein VGG32_10270 [Thermoplasmata archaeon]